MICQQDISGFLSGFYVRGGGGGGGGQMKVCRTIGGGMGFSLFN